MNLWKIEKIKSITPLQTHDLWKKIINWKRELHSNHLATEAAWNESRFHCVNLQLNWLSLNSVWAQSDQPIRALSFSLTMHSVYFYCDFYIKWRVSKTCILFVFFCVGKVSWYNHDRYLFFLPHAIFEVRLEAQRFATFYFTLLDGRSTEEVVKFDSFDSGDTSFIGRRFWSLPEMDVLL